MYLKLVLSMFLATAGLPAPLPAQSIEDAIQAYKLRDFEEAEKHFRGLLNEEPDRADARAYLALTLVERDKREEAEAELEAAQKLDAESIVVKVAAAELQANRDQLELAEQTITDAVRQSPSNTLALYHRGLILFRRDRYEAAAADFESVIAKDPADAYPYYYAGLTYSRLKRPDKMVDRYQRFMKMKPDAPEAPRIRALLRGIG